MMLNLKMSQVPKRCLNADHFRATAAWLVSGLLCHEVAAAAASPLVTPHSQGLHGYIGFGHERFPPQSAFTAGGGFYSAVWSLVDQPLAGFQIGLPGMWITPDNSDDKDTPLAPEGTLARTWKERGPTWDSVFQTVEGGLGYWRGNHFRYGPPKFSMNGTPQAYDYEVGSPGWSFFNSDEALPDNRLGLAQLSNRLLIPPDGLAFQGQPNGEFLGYTWMALPFTEPTTGDPPTGDQSWTCFLNSANFKGPIAFYIPETWSKIGKLFNAPFLHGRGLDARPGIIGGGAMEINTVPRFDAPDAQGTVYTKLPRLQFPVDAQGRACLVQDVTYYSQAALFDAFNPGATAVPPAPEDSTRKAHGNHGSTRTRRASTKRARKSPASSASSTPGFSRAMSGDCSGSPTTLSPNGEFPQYFKRTGEECVPVAAADVPAETKLPLQKFKLARPGLALYFPNHRRVGTARTEARPVHGQTRGWFRGDLRVVSFR